MNSSLKPETTPTVQQPSSIPKYHNPYAKMSTRRAIACTICAKAKTKCDKLVPSCSRCTAKGLQCEPRSTRRTSDNNYRNPRKPMVSPKRYNSTNSVPVLSRHGSPRSVPSSSRQPLVRSVSHMDFHTAVKLGQRPDFATTMLTPLQTYSSHIENGYSYSSSPEQNMSAFPHQMDRSTSHSGRLTPQTPESFIYHEPVSVMDNFDPYLSHSWSDNSHIPVGLGFGDEIPGMMPRDAEMRLWTTPEPETVPTSMGHLNTFEPSLCGSPASINTWSNPSLSVSPPQMAHSRPVPALSISECSIQDYDSPNVTQEEWNSYMKPITSAPYYDNMKPLSHSHMWDENMMSRSSTF